MSHKPGSVHVVVDARAEHLAYHGLGLTFGELAIGERFEWAPPLPVGRPEPLVKVTADRYAWSRGTGTAADYYRVERRRG